MSLVTLKKKIQAQKNISTEEGFSLKGTTRNISGIGSNPNKRPVRTIFKGTSPTGYGGLPSRDTTQRVRAKGSNFSLYILNNNTTQVTIKSVPTSTMTTKGLLLSKVYHPTKSSDNSGCGKEEQCPIWWVKNFNPLAKTQSEYIKTKKIKCSVEDDGSGVVGCKNTYFIGTRKISKNTYHKTTTSGAITSGEFTEMNVLQNNCLPTPPCKKPFPFILNKNGCNQDYVTPQEAQAAGLLPENWMTCSSKYSINPYETTG